MKYKETNGIPICPFCEKPTQRTGGMGATTAMYFQPVYNEKGENVNPDRNISTQNWACLGCGNAYQTKGKPADGFSYTEQYISNRKLAKLTG